ncbi:UNVERIFIED_CONTAM: hypothetical protein HDU68_011531 [Siphonaria sp. JEL0065]|nr:hypothetical protein HDU68_011531 [Siphonaria sp. JEL0065]
MHLLSPSTSLSSTRATTSTSAVDLSLLGQSLSIKSFKATVIEMQCTASTARTPLIVASTLALSDLSTTTTSNHESAATPTPLPQSASLPIELNDIESEYISDSDENQQNEPNQQEQPPTELEYAIQVGQYLLDQNQELEESLKASREEAEWLLSVLAKLDPDLVSEAMAADDHVVIRSKDESEVVAQLRRELGVAMSELGELRDQV